MSQIDLGNNESTSVSFTENQEWKPEEVPQLTVDVYRKGDIVYVVSTVAGVSSKDLDISVEENTVSIRGVRKRPYGDNNEEMILLEECFWGEFYRELTINENLDVDNIKASLNQGVLVVEIPILKTVKQKRIQINSR